MDRENQKEIKKLVKERRKHKTNSPNPKYIRYEYVRYADDWLVGIWGPKSEVRWLKENMKNFLKELKLELSVEKTLITNAREKEAKFLGINIKRQSQNSGFSRLITHLGGARRRAPPGNLWMTMPTEDIISRLLKKGFLIKERDKLFPQAINRFLVLPIKEMILRFRVILYGYLNYFSFVDNPTGMLKIFWVLKRCLQKTICRKKDIGYKSLLKSFGRDTTLKVLRRDGQLVTLDFKRPEITRQPMRFYGTKVHPDPMLDKIWKISTISALGQGCANCGSRENIEMHHIKHIRTINVKLSKFDQMAARINRKQIPLCRPCHNRVHQGEHQGLSLRHFIYIKWKGTPKWS